MFSPFIFVTISLLSLQELFYLLSNVGGRPGYGRLDTIEDNVYDFDGVSTLGRKHVEPMIRTIIGSREFVFDAEKVPETTTMKIKYDFICWLHDMSYIIQLCRRLIGFLSYNTINEEGYFAHPGKTTNQRRPERPADCTFICWLVSHRR